MVLSSRKINSEINPLVSVVIPVYNGEKYLAEAIDSVLAQSYDPIEIIVVDDGSADGTRGIADQFEDKIQYHFQANQGSSAARNTGIAVAKGEYFAFLDADDTWMPEKVSLQMDAFRLDPTLEMVSSFMEQFFSPELTEEEKARVEMPPDNMDGFLATTVVVKASYFHRVGLLDTRWTIGEFLDWHLRAREIGVKSHSIEKPLARRRIHTTNKGIVLKEFQSERAQIIKASLDRRRARVTRHNTE